MTIHQVPVIFMTVKIKIKTLNAHPHAKTAPALKSIL